MHIDSEAIDRGWKSKYSIGVSKDIPYEDKKPIVDPNCGTSTPGLLKARFAIGHLLYSLCAEPTILSGRKGNKFDTAYFVMKANEVSSEECASLVNKFWNKDLQAELLAKQKIDLDPNVKKLEVGKLQKEDLLVACGAR
jgi:hypothetical protein